MSDWLDGPGLVEWLDTHCPESMAVMARWDEEGTFSRRIYDWRRGSKADVYIVDRLLTTLGLHLSLLPDELWTESPRPGGFKNYTAEFRRKVALSEGSPQELSDRFGVSTRSVSNWRRELVG